MSEIETNERPATIAEVASEGGRARAERLTPEERSDIARKAAEARWNADLPKATHEGMLHIGTLEEIPCSVLADKTRVLSERGIAKALGKNNRMRRGMTEGGIRLPSFVSASKLKPFISQELESVLTKPIVYQPLQGGKAHGILATVLPGICDVWLQAKNAGVLTAQQQHIAERAYILMRGFADVGIIALVDEATGYQEVRDRQALQEYLDRFLRKEFANWAKRFPEDFYKEIFRLRGWTWKGMKINRPQCVAQYTKDLVYARLGPGILKELETRNPVTSKGRRVAPHYYWLTEDIGHPALAQHLYGVIGFLRVAATWEELMRMLNKAYPKRGDTLDFPLFNNLPDNDGPPHVPSLPSP